jgi:hypothetical protein
MGSTRPKRLPSPWWCSPVARSNSTYSMKDPHGDPRSCRESQFFRRRWPAAVGCQVQCPQPDPVVGLHQPQRGWIHTDPRGAVGVPQLRVVEDVAASAGAATTVRAINPYPVGAAARHPRQLHGRSQGSSTGRPTVMSTASLCSVAVDRRTPSGVRQFRSMRWTCARWVAPAGCTPARGARPGCSRSAAVALGGPRSPGAPRAQGVAQSPVWLCSSQPAHHRILFEWE